MLWTLLILAVAVAAYFGAGMLCTDDKKKGVFKYARYLKKSVKLIAIVLLVWGLNRTGMGTEHYLVESNPGILQSMVEGIKAQQTKNSGREIRKYVKGRQAELIKNAPIMGNVDGTKTIFLFSAHSCSFCQRVHHELERIVSEDPSVRVAIKNFSIHGPLSDSAARATIAAKLQGNDKAAELDRLLMEKPYWPADMKNMSPDQVNKAVRASVLKLAAKAKLDTEKLSRDMDNAPEVAAELRQVSELAQAFQISGTPYLIIGDQAFPGAIPYEQIRDALNKIK